MLVLGFMVATAFISMMISNTSATLLMYPIAVAVLLQLSELRTNNDEARAEGTNWQVALMLGIAYASSVGGIGTLIGTPPNVIFAGSVRSLYPNAPEIEFFQWLIIGIPLVILFLPIVWLCLTRISFPVAQTKIAGDSQYIRQQLTKLGRMQRGEALTLWVFVLTAIGLVFRRDINLGLFTIPGWTNQLGIDQWVSDTTVVMSAALLSFAVPVNLRKGEFLLDWKSAVKIPWGLLLLFGGGITLAMGFQTTGLAAWIGAQLTYLNQVPVIMMIFLICLMLTFLTELASNTAMVTVFMPILAATATAMQVHPFLLMIPATISASCAFMLPVATAPNAVIFGSGYLSIQQMAKAGIILNIIGAFLVTLLVYLLAIPVFGITLDSVPVWAN
jgi:sodium-dependent dicarboxylate transporter 2/3/5